MTEMFDVKTGNKVRVWIGTSGKLYQMNYGDVTFVS